MAITAGKTQNFYMKMRNNNKIDAAYTVHMISATFSRKQWKTTCPPVDDMHSFYTEMFKIC